MQAHSAVVISQASGITHSRVGCGIVTAPALGDILRATLRILDGDQPLLHLADLRRPLWAVTDSELDHPYVGLDPRIIAPAAMLVTLENYAQFRRHAWQMAQQGILRKIFTDEVAAAEWCRLRMAMARQERTAQGSPPPGPGLSGH